MRLLVRFLGFLFAAGTVVFLVAVAAVAGLIWHFSKDLPDYSQLQDYEPPVMTRVHAADGSLLGEYSKERRLYLPIQAVPKLVINAFLAAEDKNFYEHGGIDYSGMARAALLYAQNFGSNRRPQGASTITQQVAKNFLLTNEVSFTRKIKEALAGDADRADLFEGQDPRTLSQRNLSRPWRLRRCGGLARLLRQVGERTHGRGGLLSRRVAEGAGRAASGTQPRSRNRAPQLCDRPSARKRLGQHSRRRQGPQVPVDRHQPGQRRAYVRRRIFRRRSPPRYLRAIRREEALRGRPVRSRHARSENPGDGAQDHGRRHRQLRRGAGLARRSEQARYFRRLGRQARRRQIAVGRLAVADGGGSGHQRSVGPHRFSAGP